MSAGGQDLTGSAPEAERYIIALDQGTTSSRAVLFDADANIRGIAQREFEQHFPQPGWVEHDPLDILGSQLGVLRELLDEHGLSAKDIEALGITNQRETSVVWDARTGEPFGNAIVWQCRRTARMVEELCSNPQVRESIIDTTGLVPDAYFSASKIKWILDKVPGAREAAEAGHARFGTVDSWLIYNLTGGQVHATDYTNASRTMLFDIHQGAWSEWLCELFDVPMSMLPEVRPSSAFYGRTATRTPLAAAGLQGEHAASPTKAPAFDEMPEGIAIGGVAGDQQAALFGQCCTREGSAKNTFGTGCFMLMHTGTRAIRSQHGLVTTLAASPPGTGFLEYALEGSVFVAGSLIQWLRDELGIIATAAEVEELAASVPNSAGVTIVPAFTGLGAPYWDAQARGAIFGLTRGSGRAHIARAALEALAFQLSDLVQAMHADTATTLQGIAVDGGACADDLLMQITADILGIRLERPANVESTACGAAYLAGLQAGYWSGMEEISRKRVLERTFEPSMDPEEREARLAHWADCVNRTLAHQLP